jgi:hypothetical protein
MEVVKRRLLSQNTKLTAVGLNGVCGLACDH